MMTAFSSGLTLVVLLTPGLNGSVAARTAPHHAAAFALAGTHSALAPVQVFMLQPAPMPPLPPNPPNIISSRRLTIRDPNAPGPEIQKMPSQWLGVRLTPIPEPLAAHIGDHGVMIANVVKGSPADQAGIERYDVIVSLNSQQIADSQDLFAALEDTKPGQSMPLAVIRGAQKKELTITPTARPANPQVDWKYEEPELGTIDREMRLRGHKLIPGPGGGWQWEELGPMYSLPDILRDLDMPDLDQFMRIEPWAEEDRALDEAVPDQDMKARVEVRVQVDENGGTLTVWRDKDGKINVKRVDPQGKESSATYESMDEFRQSDPDAFKAYRPFSSTGPDSWTFVHPQRPQLGKLRQDFQIEIEAKLRDALDRAKAAEEEAGKAVERARERLEQYQSGPQADKQGKVDEHRTVIEKTQNLSVRIEDGHISVTVDDGQGPHTYQFKSKEEFKQQKPDLYERCKQLLE